MEFFKRLSFFRRQKNSCVCDAFKAKPVCPHWTSTQLPCIWVSPSACLPESYSANVVSPVEYMMESMGDRNLRFSYGSLVGGREHLKCHILQGKFFPHCVKTLAQRKETNCLTLFQWLGFLYAKVILQALQLIAVVFRFQKVLKVKIEKIKLYFWHKCDL